MGLDFQSLLHPLFESVALQLFASHLTGAVEAFNSRLESHKWVALPTPMHKTRQQEQAKATAAAAAAATEGSTTEGTSATSPVDATPQGSVPPEDLSPPYVIMENLPLAVLTNAVLSAFNELRHCALLSLGRPAAG